MNNWKKSNDSCPKCGSNDTQALSIKRNTNKPKVIGAPIPSPSGSGESKMKCNSCGFIEIVSW